MYLKHANQTYLSVLSVGGNIQIFSLSDRIFLVKKVHKIIAVERRGNTLFSRTEAFIQPGYSSEKQPGLFLCELRVVSSSGNKVV